MSFFSADRAEQRRGHNRGADGRGSCAHEGATHHVGKVPARRGGTGVPAKRSVDLTRLQKELKRAVESEDYERAAKLRDQIKVAEANG